jgi:hypothetical protein
MSNNEKSSFLVYDCWETLGSHGGIIAGSHLYNLLILTEEEAQKAVTFLKTRMPNDKHTKHRVVYIKNNPEWWN